MRPESQRVRALPSEPTASEADHRFTCVFWSPACPRKWRVGANSPSLCPTICSEMNTGTCLRPSWTAIVCPTISGKIVEVRDHVRTICFEPEAFIASMRPSSRSSTNGPFLLLRLIQLPLVLPAATAANDQLVGFLVLRAGALAERRHAPGRDRVAAALRLPLAAAVRVVDGVHRGAAHGRTLAEPAAAARLADRDVAVLDVPDLADGRAAGEEHAAHLARRQPQRRVAAVLRDELHARAGRARHLAALPGLQLDVVHERARRDVLERERVPRLDVGADARLDDRADPHAGRREDVALEAVRVVQQRDPGRAVRVVLDRGHLRGHPVLRPLEVDEAVAALVAAALVARRDPARVVAAALLRELLGE